MFEVTFLVFLDQNGECLEYFLYDLKVTNALSWTQFPATKEIWVTAVNGGLER